MKCNRGTQFVCTCWEKCNKASFCNNLPRGIKAKIRKEVFQKQLARNS